MGKQKLRVENFRVGDETHMELMHLPIAGALLGHSAQGGHRRVGSRILPVHKIAEFGALHKAGEFGYFVFKGHRVEARPRLPPTPVGQRPFGSPLLLQL